MVNENKTFKIKIKISIHILHLQIHHLDAPEASYAHGAIRIYLIFYNFYYYLSFLLKCLHFQKCLIKLDDVLYNMENILQTTTSFACLTTSCNGIKTIFHKNRPDETMRYWNVINKFLFRCNSSTLNT